MSIVNAENFTFTYPGNEEPTLKNVSFNIEQGEILGIIGPLGAGKTTLCMAIAGFVPSVTGGETSGKIRLASRNSSEREDEANNSSSESQNRQVGIVFEDYAAQIIQLQVLEEVVTPLRDRGMSAEDADDRARKLLKTVGLEDRNLEKRRVWELSVGQQLRLALAAVLAIDPPIIILDNILDKLDPGEQNLVIQIVKDMTGDKTFAIVEQNITLIQQLVNRFLVVIDGEVVEQGQSDDILRNQDLLSRADILPPLPLQIARELNLSETPLTFEAFEQAIKNRNSNFRKNQSEDRPSAQETADPEPVGVQDNEVRPDESRDFGDRRPVQSREFNRQLIETIDCTMQDRRQIEVEAFNRELIEAIDLTDDEPETEPEAPRQQPVPPEEVNPQPTTITQDYRVQAHKHQNNGHRQPVQPDEVNPNPQRTVTVDYRLKAHESQDNRTQDNHNHQHQRANRVERQNHQLVEIGDNHNGGVRADRQQNHRTRKPVKPAGQPQDSTPNRRVESDGDRENHSSGDRENHSSGDRNFGRPLIRIEDVTFCYDTDGNSIKALENVSITVRQGEVHGVIGRSGAGKTTLIQLIAGLLTPTQGKVYIEDAQTTEQEVPEIAMKVATVLQDPDNHLSEKTVRDELVFPLKQRQRKNHRYDDNYIEERRSEVCNRVGIEENLLNQDPFLLPQGQRKLIAIAAALMVDPNILLIDEPNGSIGRTSRQRISEVIVHLRDQNKAVLVAGNDIDFITSTADTLTILEQGRVISQGSVHEVFAEDNWERLGELHFQPPSVTRLGRRVGINAVKYDELVSQLSTK